MVRFFIMYHDYNHNAILKNSKLAQILMTLYGLFILAPMTIWKRSHDYHHWNNSKLSNNGIGSFPLVSKKDFLKFTKRERTIYLATRHPLAIAFGYFTLFVFGLNLRTFLYSPKKHWDSIVSLVVHFSIAMILLNYGGWGLLITSWIIPFLLGNGIGAYLFYAQHNFPGAKFAEGEDWDYTQAAMLSTSYIKMGPIMRWFTGDIGFHHIHHINHHIPFYRLEEAMNGIKELQNPIVVTLSIRDIIACLRLKVWDNSRDQMIGLKEIYAGEDIRRN